MSEAPTVTAPKTFDEATEALKRSLPGYEERAEQAALAAAIEAAWRDGNILVAQAGTGTGKSLAATIPSILSGKRTVYSTATKALQSQIVEKDLPFLAAHLGVPFTYAMLQGRSNYACHLRMVEAAADNPVVSDNLAAMRADDDAHEKDFDFEISGLRDEMPFETDNVSWSKMTIPSDECPRKKCPFYGVCRYQSAKERAARSQIVVANHALVALDARVVEQSGGNGGILGEFEHLVVDECHELEEYITSALTWGQTINSYKSLQTEVVALLRSGEFEEADADAVETEAMGLVAYADQFFQTFEDGRVRHRDAVANSAPVESLIASLSSIANILSEYLDASEDFDRTVRARYNRMVSRVANLRVALMDFLFKRDSEVVRQFETEYRGSNRVRVMKVIPVRIGDWARQWIWERVTPTLISATVLVDGKADYIADRLGFTDELRSGGVSVLDVGSPFDFDRQSRLYIPQHISDPSPKNRDRWESEMLPLMEELVEISDGRALLLFTSRSQMDKAWEAFAHRIKHPVRKQGDMPNAHLTRWFREETNSVLFATRSFFTGIDVQGESLSLVVIDKLPFPVPTDPVIEARSEDVERRGGNSFSDLTIPLMTLVLQQAFGRLIRTRKDRGVVAIMDPRLQTKGYGTKIRRSLPGPTCFDLNDVERFFDEIDN